MSSTRHAAKGSALRQERFASNSAYRKALLGNLVAKRCSKVKTAKGRSLIYFLHDLTLRETKAKHHTCNLFPQWPWKSTVEHEEAAFERVAREVCDIYPNQCDRRAEHAIPKVLLSACLDPRIEVEDMACESAPDLFQTLLEYQSLFESAADGQIAHTETATQVFEVLDFALSQRAFVLIEGNYRTGKSYAAQAWAQKNLGRARYCQLPSVKDDHGFYREIARALGVASSCQLKARDMRARVESVLHEGHLLLVLDESDWIWPQVVRVAEVPQRVFWILTSLINNGVPVALIASRNFSRLMQNVEKRCQVAGLEQFHGRLRLRHRLPDAPSEIDLFALALAALPGASNSTVKLIVGHALKSDLPIPSIESLTTRARYFASVEGRQPEFSDVEKAMQEAGTLPPAKPARHPRAAPAMLPPERWTTPTNALLS